MKNQPRFKRHKVKKHWVTIAVTSTALAAALAGAPALAEEQDADRQAKTELAAPTAETEKTATPVAEPQAQETPQDPAAQDKEQEQTPNDKAVDVLEAETPQSEQAKQETEQNNQAAEKQDDQTDDQAAVQNNLAPEEQADNQAADQNNQAAQAHNQAAEPATPAQPADLKIQAPNNSKAAHSFNEEDGKWYFLDANLEKVTGWQTINGKKLYFDKDGSQVKGKKLTVDGEGYYFDQDSGEMWTSRFLRQSEKNYEYSFIDDNIWYYFGADGKAVKGLQTIDGQPMYFYGNGQQAKGKLINLDNQFYYFDGDNGHMWTNRFVHIRHGNNYYYNPTFSGWLYLGADGKAVTGWQTINGKKMYFLKKGDYQESDDGYGQYYQYGVQTKKYVVTNDLKRYFFDQDSGELLTNQDITYDGHQYHLDADGVATQITKDATQPADTQTKGYFEQREFINPRNSKQYKAWVYVGEDGKPVTGRQVLAGRNTYFFDNGEQARGQFVEIDGNVYYFDPNTGAMKTNTEVPMGPDRAVHYLLDLPVGSGSLKLGEDGAAYTGYLNTVKNGPNGIEYATYTYKRNADGKGEWTKIK